MKKKTIWYIVLFMILILVLMLFFGYEKGIVFGSWGRNRTIDWKYD